MRAIKKEKCDDAGLFESGSAVASRRWFIYVLRDPRHFYEVRYVGWSYEPRQRYLNHLSGREHPRCYRAKWIASCLADGVTPTMDIVESGVGPDWREAERRWIQFLRKHGCRLTNATDGGDGVPGLKHSALSREKMATKKRGRQLSEEHRRRIGMANIGKHTMTPVNKAKMTEGRRRIVFTPERIAAFREQAMSRFQNPEVWAKRNATNTGRPRSAESREKQRAAMLGRTLTVEHRAKLSAAKLGKPHWSKRLRAEDNSNG